MKKFLIPLLLIVSNLFGQETATDSTKHWTRKGVFTLLANQSSFSNWQGVRITSLGMLV